MQKYIEYCHLWITLTMLTEKKLWWKISNSNGLNYPKTMKNFQSCHFWLCNEKDYLQPKSHNFIDLFRFFTSESNLCVFLWLYKSKSYDKDLMRLKKEEIWLLNLKCSTTFKVIIPILSKWMIISLDRLFLKV